MIVVIELWNLEKEKEISVTELLCWQQAGPMLCGCFVCLSYFDRLSFLLILLCKKGR